MSGIVTMSSLGKRGRTGNAFFQYAFLRGYAKAVGAEIQTPMWWGRAVFPVAAADPFIDKERPQTLCDSLCHHRNLPLDYFAGRTDVDLMGYYQSQVFLEYYSRQQVRNWFAIKPELEEYAPSNTTTPYSAKHLRRGDYLEAPFNRLYCTVSDESYDQAIRTFGIPEPVIPVFDGCEAPFKSLVDLGVPWLRDWLVLRDADHLLRANSSFSFWASELGNGKTYSPVVEKKVGLQHVPFAIGNWPTLAGVFANNSDMRIKSE